MIDLLTNEELREIAETQAANCVSLYLPTHRAGPDVQQDPIRLKNLLSDATTELEALGIHRDAARDLLAPAAALVKDQDFWAHGDAGLAVLVGDDRMRTVRLAEPVADLVVVANRFHVKPLLHSVTAGQVFWILAISQNRVRLLRGGPTAAAELELGDIPDSLAAALWFEDRERQLQSHGATRVGRGRVSATFHGQGMGKDTRHADLARFLRAVDDGVRHLVADGSQPIVLAGVERDLAAYREVSRTKNLVDGGFTGNCDHLSAAELHAGTWPLVRDRFDADRRRISDEILSGTGQSESDVSTVMAAASEGRVAAVLVALGVQVWGTTHTDGPPAIHQTHQPGDRDILDAVAIETMEHGGDVHAVPASEVPGDAPLAALLRW